MLNGWEASKPIYFHFGAKFDRRGTLTEESRTEILHTVVDPIFRAAEFAYVYGSHVAPGSFGGEGAAVLDLLRREKGRSVLPYSRRLFDECPSFLADSQGETYQRGVRRGTMIFWTPVGVLASDQLRARLGEVCTLSNFAGPTGAGAIRAVRRELAEAGG